MKLLPVELLHAAGITQALLLGLFFWGRRRQAGNLYEALLLLAIACSIAFGYMYGSGKILAFPHLARTAFSFTALIGPLLYLSVRARLNAGNRLRAGDLWIWIVPLGITLYLVPFHLQTAEAKLRYLREDLVEIHLDCAVILYASLINNVATIGTSLWRLQRSGAAILRQTGHPDDVRGNFTFHAAPLAAILLASAVSAADPNLLNSGLFSGVASVLILVRSYFLLYRHVQGDSPDALYPPVVRYQKALLAPDFIENRGRMIEAFLGEEQPYLEPDFQLSDVARHLELSTVQTSQIINRHFGRTFLQLVQQLRVEQAMLFFQTQPAHMTVLDIALQSGFNSKSAFNSAFKRITGCTPTRWRQTGSSASIPARGQNS